MTEMSRVLVLMLTTKKPPSCGFQNRSMKTWGSTLITCTNYVRSGVKFMAQSFAKHW